jgi:hypothetical protein
MHCPFPLPPAFAKERLFTLTWTNSKLNLAPSEKQRKREARGIRFTNGLIALDNGSTFERMSELEHHLEKAGTYTIVYDDEERVL